MKQEHNWINIFFMILVIIIIFLGISWFFGIRIPNYNSIKTGVENTVSPLIFDANISCTDNKFTQDELNINVKIYNPDIYNSQLSFWLQNKCRTTCTQNNPNRQNILIAEPYACNNDKLICECKR